jgi:hypothetical protein
MSASSFDDDALVRAAGSFVLTLRDTGKYTKAQIKKAFCARMVDAYFAIDDKRKKEEAERVKLLLKRCAAGRDGECGHPQCPQIRDGEPVKSGRHCPLDNRSDEE